tara:strand:+ start:861 stop:1406 length:546 start_codon:yes stop_codon:yes gene_type:complete
MSNFYDSQLKNRNLLSPVGFKLTLNTKRKIDFFSNTATIPALTLGTALQTTPLRNLDVPGDELLYDDFQIEFLVDEDLVNYMVVHNWLTGLGFPESYQEFKTLTTDPEQQKDDKLQYVDGSLHILNSNLRDIAVVKFQDLFPVSLTGLEFRATDDDINYFTAQATFKYMMYNILDVNGDPL